MPEPLSQEVLDRVAAQFPEADRAEVAQALLDYCVAPINFGRLMILDAVRDRATDVLRFVKIGNQYGKDWEIYDPPFGSVIPDDE
jgi:hypothetical protein